jgi:hypothetical protein
MREHGVKVLTVRDILSYGVEDHVGARVELEDLAMKVRVPLQEASMSPWKRGQPVPCLGPKLVVTSPAHRLALPVQVLRARPGALGCTPLCMGVRCLRNRHLQPQRACGISETSSGCRLDKHGDLCRRRR